MGGAGFEGIRKYVTRRQNTSAQYIVTRPIMELYEQSTRRPEARVSHSASGSKGVSAVAGTGQHRLGGGEEKGDRGSDGFGVGVGFRFGFGQRGVKWSEWVEWSGVEWGGRAKPPSVTTGRN